MVWDDIIEDRRAVARAEVAAIFGGAAAAIAKAPAVVFVAGEGPCSGDLGRHEEIFHPGRSARA